MLLFQMEANPLPNKIQISEFGLTLLHKLPAEMEDLQSGEAGGQENMSEHHYRPRNKGKALDFYSFANQTQQLLFRQTSTLFRKKQTQTANNESKRKLQLNHDHWQSEQKLISHKLSDTQARMQQQKFSEYDWRSVSQDLRTSSHCILDPLQTNFNSRHARNKSKLKRLLVRKYPNRSERS